MNHVVIMSVKHVCVDGGHFHVRIVNVTLNAVEFVERIKFLVVKNVVMQFVINAVFDQMFLGLFSFSV